LQVWPVAEQSLHVLPRVPHVAVPDFMQVPPWQQPLRQLSRLQLPPPEPDELPLDDPDELPLDDPELPLEPPDDPAQEPLWHDWVVPVQSAHVLPC